LKIRGGESGFGKHYFFSAAAFILSRLASRCSSASRNALSFFVFAFRVAASAANIARAAWFVVAALVSDRDFGGLNNPSALTGMDTVNILLINLKIVWTDKAHPLSSQQLNNYACCKFCAALFPDLLS
jgi:hypothetical protein